MNARRLHNWLFNRHIHQRVKTVLTSHCQKCSSSTIFSLSSGFGKCGVAVIRVSGPKAKFALEKLCGGVTTPRVGSVRKLRDPDTGEMLDKALVLWFPGPRSFTGEDCAEFHVHGGPAVVSSVLSALGFLDGLKPAQAGEFTKQAFLNGKMDLTEVEGLGDLIHAETEAQRRQALRQMQGELGRIYSNWRSRLIKCLANTEAFIDFHEEENIEDDILLLVQVEVAKIQREIMEHLRDNRRGERLRDGLRVVIVGQPNVGKSSLLNAICQRPAAIVSPIAGTTRDVVDTALNIAGYPVLLSDTAGLRESVDMVEKEGIARALDRARDADIKILVLDSPSHKLQLLRGDSLTEFVQQHLLKLGLANSETRGQVDNENSNFCSQTFTAEGEVTHAVLTGLSDSRLPVRGLDVTLQAVQPVVEPNPKIVINWSEFLIVANKSDLTGGGKDSLDWTGVVRLCPVSCKTGDGLTDFMEQLVTKIKSMCGNPLHGSPNLTQTRHRHHLHRCQQHLAHFHQYLNQDVVLAAERIRLATRELGEVTGAVSLEDVLDVIFRDFCIGK